jgi:hypothetical protein
MIPTLFLLFGVDIELAGSLSLAISLPTMVVGFARYGRDRSFRCPFQKSPVRVDDGCPVDRRQLYRRLPTLWSLANLDTVWAWGELTDRVADPTLFGLIGINPSPSAGGLAGARVADPTLLGLICVNPPPSAVGRHALSINGCCQKEDGSG